MITVVVIDNKTERIAEFSTDHVPAKDDAIFINGQWHKIWLREYLPKLSGSEPEEARLHVKLYRLRK